MSTSAYPQVSIANWYINFYKKFAPPAVMEPNAPSHWKEKMLYMLLHIGLTVGLVALITSMPGNIANKYWTISITIICGYMACLILFLFPQIPYFIRAATCSLFLYAIGFSIILDVGPFLASREWLLSFSIIASILLGWTGAIASISANLLAWGLTGVLIKVGFWNNFYLLDNESALLSWNTMAFGLVFINIATTTLITFFFIRLNKSDQAAKTFSQLLLREGKKLAESNQNLAHEIEEREAVSIALQKSEEKYRTILESIDDAYFEIDLKGDLMFFNRSLNECLQCSKDKLVGMNYRSLMNHKDAEKLSGVLDHVLLTGKTAPPLDIEIKYENNRITAVSVLVSLISGNNGKPMGFRGLARDITDYKAMEDRLRRAEKMEAIGTLAGGVAHDLNNILSGIVNYPELLLLNMPPDDPLRRSIQAIKNSGEKAVAIVQDLLTLARRGVTIKDTINLNLVILEYLQSNEFAMLKSFHPNVTVKKDLDKSLPNISGSPVHLSKILMNLISNAAEAISTEGTIFISTQNRHIDMVTGYYEPIAEGDYVVLTIRDTGSGIAPEDLDKIFEPFFTTKAMGRSGTGLGMAVVWGTVKDHDGQIDIQSTLGRGTTFSIYFPISPAEPVEKKEIKTKTISKEKVISA